MTPQCLTLCRRLAVVLAVAACAAMAQAAGVSNAVRIAELQRAGRIDEALALCRQENATRPGDALMLYNQACLENRSGQAEAALATLRAALDAGFDDFAHALADPDLQGADAGRFKQVIGDRVQRRGAMSARRGAVLADGRPQTLALEPAPGQGPADGARVTLTWQPAGLDLRLELDDTDGRWLPAPESRPWSGEGGVLLALGPLDPDSGETTDSFVFGFGLEKDAGVGALFVVETGQWQRVREVTPKVRGAGTARLVLDATIPWLAIAPYHPLVDPVLGINVTLLGRGGSTGPRLMPATVLDRPGAPRHLAARLDFTVDGAASGALQGRSPTSIITGTTTAINLVATSAAAGTGRLTLDFQDGEGHSLLADGPATQDVDLVAGLTRINRAVDFSQVRVGPCRVSATLVFADGSRGAWSAWLLNLGPDWEPRYREAISGLPADEQPTANYYLAAIVRAVDAHRARRHPGALATTLGDLNLMLARFRDTGSVVPAEGLSTFVYPGPGGEDRLCHFVLPPGRPAGAPLTPVILGGHSPGDAPRVAERIVRFLASPEGTPQADGAGAWPVFVVAPGERGMATRDSDAEAELRACARWARERFGAPGVLLAAQRGAVGPALALARLPEAGVRGLLLFADRELDPWPGQTAEAVAARLGPPQAGIPVTWLEFPQETALGGGSRTLASALRRAGWLLQEETVRGASNFTQVADRTCRWQATLKTAAGPAR